MRPILGEQESGNELGGSLTSKRRKVIIKGKLKKFDVQTKGVVVIERWPSWAYVLQLLGWKCLDVIFKDLSLTTKGMFVKELKITPSSLGNKFNYRSYFGGDKI